MRFSAIVLAFFRVVGTDDVMFDVIGGVHVSDALRAVNEFPNDPFPSGHARAMYRRLLSQEFFLLESELFLQPKKLFQLAEESFLLESKQFQLELEFFQLE